jgi:hypothetical protein
MENTAVIFVSVVSVISNHVSSLSSSRYIRFVEVEHAEPGSEDATEGFSAKMMWY